MEVIETTAHSAEIQRRLRGLLLSSAFTPEERDRVWSAVSSLPEYRMKDAVRWALGRVQANQRTEQPLENRLASLVEKLAYRLDEYERDPSKPIRPL